MQDIHHDRDGDLAELTLGAIAKHICKLKQDELELSFIAQHPFLSSYKAGKVFTDLPERAITELSSDGMQDAKMKKNEQPRSGPLDLSEERLFFQKRHQGTASAWKATPRRGHGEDTVELSTGVSSRRVIHWQLSYLSHMQELLVIIVKDLIDQYVPNQYPHPLLHRC